MIGYLLPFFISLTLLFHLLLFHFFSLFSFNLLLTFSFFSFNLLLLNNALLEAVLPVGDFQVIGLLDLGLVEDAVVRTCYGCGVLGGVQGTDVASGDAGQPVNGLGEVVPRADALVGEVEDARLNALGDSSHDSSGQVSRVGGRTYLIKDNSQFALLPTEAQHRLHEVVAEAAVEPGGADDESRGVGSQDSLFASEFCPAIDGVGACGEVFGIGGVGGAVEDVVGRDVDERGALFLGDRGEIFYGRAVQQESCG